MSRQTSSFLLLAGAVILLVLGAATLLPMPSSTVSDLGYFALCPFAPWSSLMLAALAGVCWALYRHIGARPK
jgi:hypothetical protein